MYRSSKTNWGSFENGQPSYECCIVKTVVVSSVYFNLLLLVVIITIFLRWTRDLFKRIYIYC